MSVPVIFVNRCRNTSNSARIKIIGKIVFVLFLFYTQIVPLPKMIFSLGYVLLVPFMILSQYPPTTCRVDDFDYSVRL